MAEAVSQDQASRSRLAELSEQVGYLKGKLEDSEVAEAAVRRKLEEQEAQVATLTQHLQKCQAQLEAAEPARRVAPSKGKQG